jgi:hypothetical protein
MNRYTLAIDALPILTEDLILNAHIDDISGELRDLNTLAFYEEGIAWELHKPESNWRQCQILFFSLVSHLTQTDLEECFPEVFIPCTSEL